MSSDNPNIEDKTTNQEVTKAENNVETEEVVISVETEEELLAKLNQKNKEQKEKELEQGDENVGYKAGQIDENIPTENPVRPEVEFDMMNKDEPKKTGFKASFLMDFFKELKVKISTFSQKLTEKQKISLAGAGAFAVVGVFVVGGVVLNSAFNKNQTFEQTAIDPAYAQILGVVQELDTVTKGANPDKLIWEEVKLSQLQIYPISWVNANFSELERKNPLISGASADPDKDGLTNRIEYLIGSDVKNKYTICGGPSLDETKPCGRTDKENYDLGINPLTGVKADQEPVFKVKRTTRGMAESMNDVFDRGYSEGIDFPTLYQKSSLIDLNSELEKVEISTVDDTRDSLLAYYNKRQEVLGQLDKASALSSFLDVYKIAEKSNIESLVAEYKTTYESLKSVAVPKKEQETHKAITFFVSKILALAEYRLASFEDTVANQETATENKTKGLELMWAYKKLKSIDKPNPEIANPEIPNQESTSASQEK